jgi:hypothetical protein
VDVVNEQEERHHGLAALLQAEFSRLLHGVDGVAAGIGEPDYLCLGVLRLQQQRGEVRGVERMLCRAQHLAAVLFDVVGGLRLDTLAEREIHGHKEPLLAAARHHCRRRGVAGGPDIVDPLNGVGRTGFSSKVGARCR